MTRPDTLSVLLTSAARRTSLVHLEEREPRPGSTAAWPDWADAELVTAYVRLGVERPWVHQVEAADAAWSGTHTVLATSTGSGKSLAAWLPALTAVRRPPEQPGRISSLRRRAAVLYLAPTKALAADQRHGLERLLAAGELRDVRVATCDGDTPLDERDWARDHADVVLSNPDFLHFSMLPGHRRWDRLLRGLRYVVVDECHAYRGVFGAHVSLVLRRLLRLAEAAGAAPTVVMASATTGDPGATAARLIGVAPDRVHAVTRDASPQGRRRIALWEPPPTRETGAAPAPVSVEEGGDAADAGVLEGDFPRRSALAETADLLADLVRGRRRTLAFVRSRIGAEVVATEALDHLGDAVAGARRPPVAAYRGGYLPEERRDLEADLRTGDLLALATTNALELGVDVAGLDAVLMAGWPGTRVSFWQQSGRAGRAGAEGLAVLVASENPLDTYLVHHPEAIFDEQVEATSFDPTNPYVLAPHLCAAAAERPLTDVDLERFGLPDASLLDELERRALLRRRPTGWYWNHALVDPPSRLTDLRGSGGQAPVQVVEDGTGRLLGTVDGSRADATVHAGAVYVHQGRTFEVLGLADDVALVTAQHVTYRTRSRSTTHVRVAAELRTTSWGPVTWGYGQLEVSSQVLGYDRRRLPGMEIIGSYPLELPVRTFATTGVWWTAPLDALREAGLDVGDVPGALHAAEHAAIGMLPLLATCDRWDIGGLSTALHEDTGQPTVFVYDGYPGGAGFAERGYGIADRWISATADAIAACACVTGCPRCVFSPKCGNGNSPIDKAGALRVLDYLRARAAGA
ncbi:DEAD/DEAH box helicase domain protein [Beutenbergia cavernae DSM 12333]|uniref:DEAD/DEAH box helicase domain protein n=1 Tax=Beutenbergia cavernae (strain ATCC BAA-8 / DSM 12333 / CCUG 43141 / JCM 11478 / NBRC 16432 / NCIMB 13614 / HKI 0122) TaxID=471853 RepID=C5BXZ3_BEUC1|nr:DEAD/DEAH box helicase [Beutenbergia cavernae]ACQ78887.1 DEAD/DEAH box helicase domain protein [Beutenbergia cavernae DSM 12333]